MCTNVYSDMPWILPRSEGEYSSGNTEMHVRTQIDVRIRFAMFQQLRANLGRRSGSMTVVSVMDCWVSQLFTSCVQLKCVFRSRNQLACQILTKFPVS